MDWVSGQCEISMGIYYYYINDTRRQYFCIDPTDRDIKWYALGRNIGSRALSYLILENHPDSTGVEPHPLIGSWIGDRFFIAGDEYFARYNEVAATYMNIGQEIIEMLVQVAPYDLRAHGGVDWLIALFQSDGNPITISASMRQRISHELREAFQLSPNPELKRLIDALKEYTASL